MNRSQRRKLERANLKPSNKKARRMTEKANKVLEIKNKALKNSIKASFILAIIISVAIMLLSCGSEKPICDAYH